MTRVNENTYVQSAEAYTGINERSTERFDDAVSLLRVRESLVSTNGRQSRTMIRSLILRQKTEGRNRHRRRTDGSWQNGLKVRAAGRQGPRAMAGGAVSASRSLLSRTEGEANASMGGERAIVRSSPPHPTPLPSTQYVASPQAPAARPPASPGKRVGTRSTLQKWKSSTTSHRPRRRTARPSPSTAGRGGDNAVADEVQPAQAKPETEGGRWSFGLSPSSVQQREKGGPSKRSHVAGSRSPARGPTSITMACCQRSFSYRLYAHINSSIPCMYIGRRTLRVVQRTNALYWRPRSSRTKMGRTPRQTEAADRRAKSGGH